MLDSSIAKCGRIAQLVRAPGLHPGCRGFESLCDHDLKKDHARVCKWLKRLASHASTVRFRGFDSHPVYVTADAVALIESPTAGAVLPEKLMLRGAKLHFGQKVSWRSRVGDQALSTSVCLVSSVVELLPCKQSTSVRFRYEARVEHGSTLPCWRNWQTRRI